MLGPIQQTRLGVKPAGELEVGGVDRLELAGTSDRFDGPGQMAALLAQRLRQMVPRLVVLGFCLNRPFEGLARLDEIAVALELNAGRHVEPAEP